MRRMTSLTLTLTLRTINLSLRLMFDNSTKSAAVTPDTFAVFLLYDDAGKASKVRFAYKAAGQGKTEKLTRMKVKRLDR